MRDSVRLVAECPTHSDVYGRRVVGRLRRGVGDDVVSARLRASLGGREGSGDAVGSSGPSEILVAQDDFESARQLDTTDAS